MFVTHTSQLHKALLSTLQAGSWFQDHDGTVMMVVRVDFANSTGKVAVFLPNTSRVFLIVGATEVTPIPASDLQITP